MPGTNKLQPLTNAPACWICCERPTFATEVTENTEARIGQDLQDQKGLNNHCGCNFQSVLTIAAEFLKDPVDPVNLIKLT